jgi:hypothetical protein
VVETRRRSSKGVKSFYGSQRLTEPAALTDRT